MSECGSSEGFLTPKAPRPPPSLSSPPALPPLRSAAAEDEDIVIDATYNASFSTDELEGPGAWDGDWPKVASDASVFAYTAPSATRSRQNVNKQQNDRYSNALTFTTKKRPATPLPNPAKNPRITAESASNKAIIEARDLLVKAAAAEPDRPKQD